MAAVYQVPKLVRKQPFSFVVAPDQNGKASGSLYIDDGVSLSLPKHSTTSAPLSSRRDRLTVEGQFGYRPAPSIATVTFLGVVVIKRSNCPPHSVPVTEPYGGSS